MFTDEDARDEMDCESSTSCVPSHFHGLGILLVDNDTTSLSNIASTLEEHSFKVTTSELATTTLSILQEQIDKFDLVMVDVNMLEMDYFEFIRSTQLIKDIAIILMTSMMKEEIEEKAREQGVHFVLMKPISTEELKNVCKYVHRHQIEASQKPEHEAKDEEKGFKTMRSTDEKTQHKRFDPEEEEDNSLILKNNMDGREKTKRRMKWTPDLKQKFEKAVCSLREKDRPKRILEVMNVPNLTQRQVANSAEIQSPKRQAQHVQQAISSMVNQSKTMVQTSTPLVPISRSQDGVNEGYHQLRFPRETTTSLQECHEDKQPLNIESTIGNFSSISQRLYFPVNGHHFNMLEHFLYNGNHSNEFLVNCNEPLQEAYIPQPPAVPSLAPPHDFFAGLDVLIQNLELEYSNVQNSNEFPMNFNKPIQEAVPPNDFFGGLNDCNENVELDPFNFLNLDEFPVNFNEQVQEAYLPQPPGVPSLIPSSDHFIELNGETMIENHINTYYKSIQDNISTGNRNP